ncbi:MAG: transcriptional repressor LexA [Candidatus Falkowbacteria bacterium]
MNKAILTKRQAELLNFVKTFQKDYGYSPSYREIGQGLGLKSTATVAGHLQTLKKKAYLKFFENENRSIELTHKSFCLGKTMDLPLVGLITAGEPIEAIEDREMFAVPAALIRDENSFVLKVKGSSMIDEGIWDGDYVVVERNHYPKNGDIVVALLSNAYATLKKFYREKNAIRLQPANPLMQPIYCKDVAIRGIVRAIIRKFA